MPVVERPWRVEELLLAAACARILQRRGGVSSIRPDISTELIAHNTPSTASMCYGPQAHQLVVPMNPNSGLAFVALE